MRKVNNQEKVELKFLGDVLKAEIKGKADSPDLTPEKKIDIKFGAFMSAKRKFLGLSRPQLADLLKISPSTVKRIEKGETTVRKKRNLVDCICRDLKLDRIIVYNNLGIKIAAKTPGGIKRIKIDEAKRHFVYVLQKSPDYFNYFVQMFRIAQVYKAGFSKQSDHEIDRALDEVGLMASLNKLQDSRYAEFFLEQIYKLARENKNKKAAKAFFSSKMANAFTQEDWKIVLTGINPKLLETIYKVLLKMYVDGKFKDKATIAKTR